MQRKYPRLTVVQGDPTDAGSWEWILAGHDAVLSMLGVRKNPPTSVRTDLARNLIAGMKKHRVRRLV